MEWSFQTHEARNPSNEGSAVRGLRIPQRRGRLKVLDMAEDLLGIGLAQIDAITGRQILFVKVAVACPRLGGDPHEVSKDIGQHIPFRMQASNFDLPFARFAVPDKGMTVRCCRAGTKIYVVRSLDRSVGPASWFRIGRRR